MSVMSIAGVSHSMFPTLWPCNHIATHIYSHVREVISLPLSVHKLRAINMGPKGPCTSRVRVDEEIELRD